MRTEAVALSSSLETALERLHARGMGLRRASEAPGPERARPSVPTGHAALDAALGNGGWPRGALAALDATPGSGATTLALGTLAAATKRRRVTLLSSTQIRPTTTGEV